MNRFSRYYPGCDGTRLAVDVYLPDPLPEGGVPAVFHVGNDPRRARYEQMKDFIDLLLARGYAVVLPEPRGYGIFLFALAAILILPVLGAVSVGLLYPVYRRYLEDAP